MILLLAHFFLQAKDNFLPEKITEFINLLLFRFLSQILK